MLENEKWCIHILRFALAAIWTECEGDDGTIENCQTIADEALNLTKQFASTGKDHTNQSTGIESWQFEKERFHNA
jgi:hypothetical protein